MADIKALAKKYEPYIIERREFIHAHPEPSMEEYETTKVIAAELDKMGIPYRLLKPTGVIAEIKGAYPGKTIGLRADYDALSITEKTDVPFKSQNDGFMHACGHDTHTAMLLGAAKILLDIKDELHGTVRLVFQPGEETAQGAKVVCEQGGLDGVDGMFGIHIGAQKPVGTVFLAPGPTHASTDMFELKIIGKAGHGAAPQQTVDATVCAAAVVMNLQTVVSRETDPTQPLVVTVGSLHSGTRFNIISGEANLNGTCRCFDVELHHHIPEMMERIIKSTCDAYRCTYEFKYDMLTEPLVNDAGMAELAWKAAEKVVDDPKTQVEKCIAQMGGEDFAEYTVHCPAAFATLGGGGEYPHHSDYFFIDEASFVTGAALHAQVAYDFLNGEE